MPELFPFVPLAAGSEALGWLTDVLPSRTSEQRIKLRSVPRQSFQYAFKLGSDQFSKAKAFARRNGAEPVLVPVWAEHTLISGAILGSASSIDFDASAADYRVGGEILIWERDDKAVTATIAAIAPTGVTLTAAIGMDFQRPTVSPVRRAWIVDGLRSTRRRGLETDGTIRFEVTDNIDLSGAAVYPLYQGLEVLTEPTERVSDISENIVRATEYVDNGFGAVAIEATKNYADFGQTIGFLAIGKAALWHRRRFLHNRKGKQKPFWLPSFSNDLQLQAAIGAADAVLTVRSIAPTGAYLGRHVMIELKNGTRFFREIINAFAVGGGNDQLTISTALGQAVAPADIAWLCFLSRVRLNSDSVTISYRFRGVFSVSAPVIEVPA
ncbi:hypothetical protein ABIA22_000342 [Sinorhizobium fredii]|uniref:hypothetical protein n=1 Tax=Rhizobium fredii TaxID=380 RepID=UPI003513C21E